MAKITPLFRSAEISVHRFTHPAEHEDQPYEEVASSYMASFVEEGAFNLEVAGAGWRVSEGDVMLSRPGMRFRASYDGVRFNDTCLSLTYLTASDERFDSEKGWTKANLSVLPASDRLRYLRWGLNRAVETGAPMFAEYCATEIFRAPAQDASPKSLSVKKFAWYAERIDFAREKLRADLEEEIAASDLARAAGMSLFHFIRIFTALVGEPPHRYRLRARLAAARAMIADGRSVTETCHACGFNNLSHFTRSFSRWYGAPPSRLVA